MKKRLFLILTCLFLFSDAFGFIRDAEQINLEHRHQQGNHIEYYPPADMPEVYFDSNDMEIIIVADGFADYYDVNIVSQSTQLAVIYIHQGRKICVN